MQADIIDVSKKMRKINKKEITVKKNLEEIRTKQQNNIGKALS